MLIHLEKLGKSFGEKIVLHDVTASVEREDRIGIVGQNGAGKTTLLKIWPLFWLSLLLWRHQLHLIVEQQKIPQLKFLRYTLIVRKRMNGILIS